MNAEDADLHRAMELERLRKEIKEASHTRGWYAGQAMQNGTKNLEYLQMRYGIPVETLQRWKDEWDRRAQAKQS